MAGHTVSPELGTKLALTRHNSLRLRPDQTVDSRYPRRLRSARPPRGPGATLGARPGAGGRAFLTAKPPIRSRKDVNGVALSIVRGEMRSQSVASSSLSGNRCFGPLKRFHASPSDQGSASVSICGLHVSADTGSRITRIDWTGPERPRGGEGVGITNNEDRLDWTGTAVGRGGCWPASGFKRSTHTNPFHLFFVS